MWTAHISPLQAQSKNISDGGITSPLAVYEERIQAGDITPSLHHTYLGLLVEERQYVKAEHYVRRRMSKDRNNLLYKLDMIWLYNKSGKERKAEKELDLVLRDHAQSLPGVRRMLNYFIERRLFEAAVKAVTYTRKKRHDPTLFTLDIALLYRLQHNQSAMIEEYLHYLVQRTPPPLTYVKSVLQSALKEEDMEMLQTILYRKAQHDPDSKVYIDMLIWAALQRQDFDHALAQSAAYDRRFQEQKSKVLEVAQVALSNNDFDHAEKGFSQVLKGTASDREKMRARWGLVAAGEGKLAGQSNPDKENAALLAKEYDKLIQQYANDPEIHEIRLKQARLYAYRLHRKDSAIKKLNNLLSRRSLPPSLLGRTKLELANLRLLNGEPWEAALLYAQVAREQKNTPIGYDAKLRQARLYYYQGSFELAREYLDILKEATTRKIANDAMELSLRIKENIMADSTGKLLKDYAAIELLLEEKRIDEALTHITALKKYCEPRRQEAAANAILDDVYWMEARIRLQRKEEEEAYTALQKIVDNFGSGVLADGAIFLQGNIMERRRQYREAQSHYMKIITLFPGSVYVAEARERYRKLQSAEDPARQHIPLSEERPVELPIE